MSTMLVHRFMLVAHPTYARTSSDDSEPKATSELVRSSTRRCTRRRRVRLATTNEKLVAASAVPIEHRARPERAYRLAVCLANAHARAGSDDSKPKAINELARGSTRRYASQCRARLLPSDDVTVMASGVQIEHGARSLSYVDDPLNTRAHRRRQPQARGDEWLGEKLNERMRFSALRATNAERR